MCSVERFIKGSKVEVGKRRDLDWLTQVFSSLLLWFDIQFMNFTVFLGSLLPQTTPSYLLKPR